MRFSSTLRDVKRQPTASLPPGLHSTSSALPARSGFAAVAAAAICAAAVFLGATPANAAQPDVVIETALGNIVVQLDPEHAPRTTANFLHYIDTRMFDGASFYRVVPRKPRPGHPTIEVIQGGLQYKPGVDVDHLPTLPLEPTTKTGLSNAAGTIAMARADKPDTASSEFFINITDDTDLDAQRFRDHLGYAVFGRVISGMDVVRRIERAPLRADPTFGHLLHPLVRITHVRRT